MEWGKKGKYNIIRNTTTNTVNKIIDNHIHKNCGRIGKKYDYKI